ncbi:MAG TPA: ABC transporter permease [Candidatus Acidoferrales bacterium]|nr:ABC transporter permease [Candidatus Acidoferrales bacterium]
MRALRAWFSRFAGLFARQRRDRELADEMESHVQMHIEDNLARGMTPAEARRQALIKLGGVEQTKETYRERRGIPFLETLLQDIRFAFRMLRKSPGFTAVAVLTLALGIGANTTVLSVVSSIILRKPPVRDPDGLLTITSKNPANVFAADRSHVSAADYLDWQEQATDFSGIAAADFDDFTISGEFAPEFVPGARVSANFFQVMEIQPTMGRPFLPGEDQPGKDHAVLLSTQLWKAKFAGDPHVLGQSIKINGNSYTIVGVMPEAFGVWDSPTQIWFPLVFSPDESGPGKRSFRFLRVFARLKPGIRMSEASAQMNTIAVRLAAAHPDTSKNWGASVMTERQYMTSDWNAERALFLLMMAVALVLLVACANVASMLLARNSGRAQEFSIRAVLGAGRLRLARQLLTECLLLSIAGGALGILFAYAGLRMILTQFNWNDTAATIATTIGIDSRVLLLTAAISFFVAIIVGIAPALRLSRRDPGERLKQATRGATAARQHHRLQRLLVVGQLSLSLILLTGAGLFVEDFVAETRAAPGLNPYNMLTASVSLRGLQYYGAPQHQSSFFQNALREIQESAQVESAALTSTLPFDGSDSAHFVVEGHPVSKPAEQPSSGCFVVSPGYFQTLQIPLLQGREFTPSDGPGAAPVVIVDAAFARRYFANQNPVGRHLLINSQQGAGSQWSEIVGVVGDVNEFRGEEKPQPHIFEPFLAHPTGTMSFVVRTRTEPTSFSDSLRHAVWAVDSAQAISDVKTMDRVIADSGQGDNIMAELMGCFALVALLMAATGIYGVLSYLVAQRTHEIGIRMALGAERRNVLALVMRNGGVLISIGVGAGALVSLTLPRAVGAVLSGFGVHQWGPLIAGTTLMVTLVALLACYIPARRAMRVDPMVALRHE